ncbi:hypothetical protein ANN_05994 [Periplaneta americana]|uniref:Uncharacterized protein n=1 Tax=Periplaneta americana TaxID=6978 RepID=A0ABQ8TCF6_PERAM|nr:hypothetical protein ANN_05994 [Periplaneta americana]
MVDYAKKVKFNMFNSVDKVLNKININMFNQHVGMLTKEDRDITYGLFCSVLCIMEQVSFDEILILSVEENPHVYDKRRASYKDENTWLSIAASLNTDRILPQIKNRFYRTITINLPKVMTEDDLSFLLKINICYNMLLKEKYKRFRLYGIIRYIIV